MKTSKRFFGKALIVVAMAICILCMSVVAQSVSAFAGSDNAVPSVQVKPAPEVKKVEYVKADGTEETIDVESGKITIISVIEATGTVKSTLTTAYNEIDGATDLGAICPDLENAAKKLDPGYAAEVLTVSDLFDVQVDTSVKPAAGERLKLTFATSAITAKADKLIVMHKVNNTTWVVVAEEYVKVNDDLTVTVSFDSFSPVAFAKVDAEKLQAYKEKKEAEKNAKCCDDCIENCPFCEILCTETGCYCWLAYVAISLAIVLVALIIALIVEKARAKKEFKVAKELLPIPEEKEEDEEDKEENADIEK